MGAGVGSGGRIHVMKGFFFFSIYHSKLFFKKTLTDLKQESNIFRL